MPAVVAAAGNAAPDAGAAAAALLAPLPAAPGTLLAAATHGAIGQPAVVAERLIGPKTNEVPKVPALLRGLAGYADISGCVLTLDALHTVRSHATLICEELLGHYVMTVKTNTPKLHEALDATDWDCVPCGTPPASPDTAARKSAPSRSWTPPITSGSCSRTSARSP